MQDVRVINQKIRAKLTFCTDKLYAQSAVPPYLKAFRLSPHRLPSQPALLRWAFTSEATRVPFASALRVPYCPIRCLPTFHRRRLSYSPVSVFFSSTVYVFIVYPLCPFVNTIYFNFACFYCFVLSFIDARNTDFNKSATNGECFYAALLKLSSLKLRD